MMMRRFNYRHLWTILALVFCLVLYCEVLVYFVVLWHCHWPELAAGHNNNQVLRAFFIADTHLLGSLKGHWFDKLRREWQMHRGFVTAVSYLDPETVFFLGDLFDEGKWASEAEFKVTVQRFHSLFPFDSSKKIVVVGNHDIGFHYDVTDNKRKRFYGAFGLDYSGVRRLTLKSIHFVLVDSLAMHGDDCEFCAPAVKKVKEIGHELHCMEAQDDPQCELAFSETYSRPILLQHFPLFRLSDIDCHNEPDVLSDPEEKAKPFKPLWDCLSEKSSQFLLESINPRLVLSGHTHNGCRQLHSLKDGSKIPEWSVASFSWRNRNNPVIVLAALTQDEFVLNKCYLPEESKVINVYTYGLLLIFVYAILTRRKFCSRL